MARQTVSDFFTSLPEQMEAAPDASVLNRSQRESLKQILSDRDQTISLLWRSDPAAADRLSDIYVSYQTMSNAGPPTKK